MRDHDRFSPRLSDYHDGELAPPERVELEAHLVQCADCRAELEELRALVRAARSLPGREPARELWPAIRARLAPRRTRPVWPLLAAAAALIVFGVWKLLPARPDASPAAAPSPRFALLLHEPPGLGAGASADEIARIVAEYRDWSRGVAADGHMLDGEKLADREGWWLRDGSARPRGDEGGLGGFFLIRAKDYDEALAIARGCPHLRHGGWIEVRRVEDT